MRVDTRAGGVAQFEVPVTTGVQIGVVLRPVEDVVFSTTVVGIHVAALPLTVKVSVILTLAPAGMCRERMETAIV